MQVLVSIVVTTRDTTMLDLLWLSSRSQSLPASHHPERQRPEQLGDGRGPLALHPPARRRRQLHLPLGPPPLGRLHHALPQTRPGRGDCPTAHQGSQVLQRFRSYGRSAKRAPGSIFTLWRPAKNELFR